MSEGAIQDSRRELPWLQAAEVLLVIATIAWLTSLVIRDYDPVKNLPIAIGEVAGNKVSCVQAPPVQAIMATAWEKVSKWDLSFLGDQYFIMGANGEVMSAWNKSDTLEHLDDPDYVDGNSVCVVYSNRQEENVEK